MPKQFIVRLGYVDYALEQRDAVELMAIAARARVVKQNGYQGPYYVQKVQDAFVDTLSLYDVVEVTGDEKPDVFTAATREAAPF